MCDTKIIEKGEVFTPRLSMEETKPRQLRVFLKLVLSVNNQETTQFQYSVVSY
jgi:hypothetical protein